MRGLSPSQEVQHFAPAQLTDAASADRTARCADGHLLLARSQRLQPWENAAAENPAWRASQRQTCDVRGPDCASRAQQRFKRGGGCCGGRDCGAESKTLRKGRDSIAGCASSTSRSAVRHEEKLHKKEQRREERQRREEKTSETETANC